eukprot:gene25096-biopygen4473
MDIETTGAGCDAPRARSRARRPAARGAAATAGALLPARAWDALGNHFEYTGPRCEPPRARMIRMGTGMVQVAFWGTWEIKYPLFAGVTEPTQLPPPCGLFEPPACTTGQRGGRSPAQSNLRMCRGR